MVVDAGPDMEKYLHKILACQYAQILPNDFTLLPKLEGSNGFILVDKLHSKFFFFPECGDHATMENLSKDSDKACVEESCFIHSKAAILEKKDGNKSLTLNEDKDQVVLVQNEPFLYLLCIQKLKRKMQKGPKFPLG